MKIQQAVVAQVRPQAALAKSVTEPVHTIAWSNEVGRALGLDANLAAQVAPTINLRAFPLSNTKTVTDAERRKIEQAALNLGAATLPAIKKCFPEAAGPIDSIEFVFAAKSAFNSWTDPQRQNVIKPLLKTTRALVELADVLKPVFPALAPMSPQFETIGVLVKVGDSLYQFYVDVSH